MKKKRATQTGALVGVRLQPDTLARLDAWRLEENDEPSRPEAMRRIIENGLRTSGRTGTIPQRDGVITPIFRVRLPMTELRALPADERAMLFLLGLAVNQLALLQKLVTFSSNKTPLDTIEQKLSGAQTQMIARLAVGALAETWQLIHRRLIGRPIGKRYLDLLSADGRRALGELRLLFGSSGLLTNLRNENVFHFPSETSIEDAFERASNDPTWDDDWDIFFGQSTLNTFFFASDVLAIHAMQKTSGAANLIEAQTRIMHEVRLANDAITEFVHEFFAAVWRTHFGVEMEAVVCGDVATAPSLFDFWIPFFVSVP
jgi:hypothetical protein